MDLTLAGRHALVGGASRGIGRACALALAAQGASITCLARSADALEELLEELPRSAGQDHAFLPVDQDDPQRVGDRVGELLAEKPVQILVNNSGGPPDGPAHTAAPEEYLVAFRRHVLCNQVLLQAVLPGMRAAGYGRVINIISTSVKQPIPNLGVSNTIRGAVASWAKTLAGELAPYGITVNNVLPGFTQTDRLDEIIANGANRAGIERAEMAERMAATVPLQRFASPSETAAAVVFLASPAAGYVNGINLPVDGGRTGCL
jgi:3-oxoacyl-[acyl-carrier protein] reductase